MMFSPELAKRFISVNSDYEGWGFVQAHYVQNGTIEMIAQKDTGNNISLPSLESTISSWAGTEDDKLNAISELELKLGEVTVKAMMKNFNIGDRTARTWLNKYNDS
jgi:hypothetical protein